MWFSLEEKDPDTLMNLIFSYLSHRGWQVQAEEFQYSLSAKDNDKDLEIEIELYRPEEGERLEVEVRLNEGDKLDLVPAYEQLKHFII